MNSRVGRYVSSHPMVALALLVFGAFAVLPVGLFLTFAVVTIIMSAAGFVVVECRCWCGLLDFWTISGVTFLRPQNWLCPSLTVFLLFVGGVTLLCVLFGIAFFSMVVSLVFNVVYITIFNFLGYSHPALTGVRWRRMIPVCITQYTAAEVPSLYLSAGEISRYECFLQTYPCCQYVLIVKHFFAEQCRKIFWLLEIISPNNLANKLYPPPRWFCWWCLFFS